MASWSFPPAPPPIAVAASASTAGAVAPRAIPSGVAAATSIAFPPVPLPTTTTAGRSCSRSRILIASSRSSPGSRSGTSAVTSATPSISPAASGEIGDQLVAAARPQLAELVAQTLVLLENLARPLDRGARILGVQRAHEVAEQRALDVDLPQGVGSDQRLDPPQARADAPSWSSRISAIARCAHVRPAAQLLE